MRIISKICVVIAMMMSLSLSQSVSAAEINIIDNEASVEERAPKGVYIAYKDVGEMTKSEIAATIDLLVAELNNFSVTIISNKGNTEIPVAGMNLYCTNKDELVNAAMGERGFGNLIQQYKQDKDLASNNKQLNPEYNIDGSMLAAYLVSQIPDLETKPVDAGISRGADGNFIITSSIPGYAIDYDGTYAQVLKAINDFDGTMIAAVEVQGQSVKATYDDSVFDGFGSVLGSCTTGFDSTEDFANRAANVRLASSRINGTVLMPGEEFSFCAAMQPFTEEAGFKPAGTYMEGQTVDSLGGGVCQVSTTLFDAVLYSELNVTFRAPHSKTVYYVDYGMDAMVFVANNQDFKFVNSTDHAIYIESYTTKGYEGNNDKDSLTFNIFGTEYREAGRSIWYEGVVKEEVLPQGNAGIYNVVADSSLDMYVKTPTKIVTYAKVDDIAHPTLTAEVVKHVYMNGVEVSAEVESWSWVRYSGSTGTLRLHPGTTISEIEWDPRTLVITKLSLSNIYIDSGTETAAPTVPVTTEADTTEEDTTGETGEETTGGEESVTESEETEAPATEAPETEAVTDPVTEEAVPSEEIPSDEPAPGEEATDAPVTEPEAPADTEVVAPEVEITEAVVTE